MSVHLSASRSYPCPVQRAFDVTLPLPLPVLFRRGHGPIPPIRGTDETSTWAEAGQARQIDLAGPGGMRELLTDVVRPSHFTYVLSDFRGPLAALVTSVEGRWSFSAEGSGVRMTWNWDLVPRRGARLAIPVLGWFWRGYAARVLAELEPHVVESRLPEPPARSG